MQSIIQNKKISYSICCSIIYCFTMVICVKKPIFTLVALIVFLLTFYLYKNPVRLIYMQIIYNCVVKFLISDLGVPSIANYYTDLLTVLIVISVLLRLTERKYNKSLIFPFSCIVGLFITGTLSFILNYSSIYLYLWALRNIFRFYGFFMGCVYLLRKEDIKRIIKILFIILLINTICCTYQYFIQGLTDDYVGGLFGTIVGGNSSMNAFLCQITIFSVIMYLNKKQSTIVTGFVILLSLYISTISELKMYYIEFIFVIILGILFSSISKRTIITILFCVFGAIISIPILYNLYPNFDNFFSIESMVKYSGSGGYSSGEDDGSINRLTAIQTIEESILKNPYKRLLGLGMGNAETSQFSMFNSSFYKDYGADLRYNWFSHAFMFIECGYIGLIMYFGFFISIFLSCRKIIINSKEDRAYLIIAKITALTCFLYGFYNASLRIESSGYIIYLFLAIPFILENKKMNKKGFN